MLKKLQNLLFEDEEDDIEEEENEVKAPVASAPVQQAPVAPVAPQPVAPVTPQPVVTPVTTVETPKPVEPVQPAMTRIDVTQPIQKIVPEKQEKTTLGITVDKPKVEKKQPAKPVAVKPAVKPIKKEQKATAPVYQFRPVISPIFGVDEKDMASLKNTTNKINNNKNAKNIGMNVTPVISPMYGADKEEVEVNNTNDDEITNDLMSRIDEKTVQADDAIPEFSLDDILKVRDEEFAKEERPVTLDESPAFPELNFDDDETPVIEPKKAPAKVAPAEEEAIDNTVVIKNQLFDDDEM